MADQYNQYSQYGQGQGQYAQQQQAYDQHSGYQQQQQQQGFDQYSGYQQQGQQQYGAPEGYGAPARSDSFGPPQAGGFQHGQQGGQYGAYDASNPQGQPGYYGGPGQDTRGYEQGYLNEAPYDPNNHQQPGGHADPNAPYDPNAPEGERGLGSSLVGGVAGHYLGKQTGHGFLGTVGGAIVANLVGSKFKDHKDHKKHSSSSWGGSRY